MATIEPNKELKRPEEEGVVIAHEQSAPEIAKPQEDTRSRIGEVVYPKENVPTMSSVRTELDAFNAQQLRVLEAINRNPTMLEKAGSALDHRRIAKSVTGISIAQNEALAEKYKAGSAEERVKISDANQKRVEGYVGVIGNSAKSILTSVGHGIGGFLGGLGTVAKGIISGTVDVIAYTADKAWFGSWRAYHKYKNDKKAIKSQLK